MPNEKYKVALVDGYTQSQKTWKVFELISDLLSHSSENPTLVLYITQANSTSSVCQTMTRICQDAVLQTHVSPNRVVRARMPLEDVAKHAIIVDFWNSNNTKAMLHQLQSTSSVFTRVAIIFDECDQGGYFGTFSRLKFVESVENLLNSKQRNNLHLCLITATIANLSKSILKAAMAIGDEDHTEFSSKGIVNALITKPIVQHHFVTPDAAYIGPSWFFETKDVWIPLIMPTNRKQIKTSTQVPGQIQKSVQSKRKQQDNKFMHICKALLDVPLEKKKLCLIASSTEKHDQNALGSAIITQNIFNVVVILNSEETKDYRVMYRSKGDGNGSICEWQVPFKKLENLADQQGLSMYTSNAKSHKTSITSRYDLCLPCVLQACLFLNTPAYHNNIELFVKDKTSYNDLVAVSQTVVNMPKPHCRPYDYPSSPTVAIIAGHIAGRGVTIQSARYNFVCSSFLFTDAHDNSQRGATSSQRFGRACGILGEIYNMDPARKPLLIATKNIMQAALSNELALKEKMKDTEYGRPILLKSLVDKETWDALSSKTKENVKRVATDRTATPKTTKEKFTNESHDSTSMKSKQKKKLATTKVALRILEMIAYSESKSLRLRDIKEINPEIAEYLESQNRRTLTQLAEQGYLINVKDGGRWQITSKGLELLSVE
jgi:hypothetical protein